LTATSTSAQQLGDNLATGQKFARFVTGGAVDDEGEVLHPRSPGCLGIAGFRAAVPKVRIHLPPAKSHTNSIIGWSYLGARRSNRKLVRHASPRIYSSFSKPVLCPRLFAILTQPKVILELTTIHRLLSIFTSPRRPRTSAQDRCSEPTTFDLGWLLLL
jgi:hypothetical protein